MNKILELRKAIVAALRAAHPRVYFEEATEGAEYPYLVYELPDSIDDGTLEQFVLDVDGWDAPKGGDTTALETMMDAADRAINRLAVTVDDRLAITFYRDNRLSLRDDDPRIRRRKYVYQARTYERRA